LSGAGIVLVPCALSVLEITMKKKMLGVVLAILPALAVAQAPPPANPNLPSFRESVEVRVMDLDVVVTDNNGSAFPDRKKEDFTVRVAMASRFRSTTSPCGRGRDPRSRLATASPELVLAERKGPACVPRHFLIYFDLGHLSPSGRKRGVDALRDLVTRMGPGDSARVVSFDRRSKTLNEWTTSKETLLSSFDSIERAGVAQSRLMTEIQTLRDIDTTRGRSRVFLAHNYAEQERIEVQKRLVDMNTEMATLTALNGKKSFLFVSGGFDMQPGSAMIQYALGTFSLSQYETRSVAPEVEAAVASRQRVRYHVLHRLCTRSDRGRWQCRRRRSAAQPPGRRLLRAPGQPGGSRPARPADGRSGAPEYQRRLPRDLADVCRHFELLLDRRDRLEAPGHGLPRRESRGQPAGHRRARPARICSALAKRESFAMRRAALRSNVEYKAILVTMFRPATRGKKHYVLPSSLIPASFLTFLRKAKRPRRRRLTSP
jgi:hypothetical protein